MAHCMDATTLLIWERLMAKTLCGSQPTFSVHVMVAMAVVGAGVSVIHLDSALRGVETCQADALPRNAVTLPDGFRRTTHRVLVEPVNRQQCVTETAHDGATCIAVNGQPGDDGKMQGLRQLACRVAGHKHVCTLGCCTQKGIVISAGMGCALECSHHSSQDMCCAVARPCVEDGPSAQDEQLSSKEAAMHVLSILQVALCCCGYQMLGITLDEHLLQQSNIKICLLDVLSNEPVSVQIIRSAPREAAAMTTIRSYSTCKCPRNHGHIQRHMQAPHEAQDAWSARD